MRISEVHASMREEIKAQGPLTNKASGLRSRQNRGVARRHRDIKRHEAKLREAITLHNKRRAHRLGRCNLHNG